MITIAEVIEQCRRIVKAECVGFANDDEQLDRIADDIRALAAQYEGCIVAEGDVWLFYEDKTLYRAREAK